MKAFFHQKVDEKLAFLDYTLTPQKAKPLKMRLHRLTFVHVMRHG